MEEDKEKIDQKLKELNDKEFKRSETRPWGIIVGNHYTAAAEIKSDKINILGKGTLLKFFYNSDTGELKIFVARKFEKEDEKKEENKE